MKKITNEEFIKRAKEVHGDKYDYSLTNYKNSRQKIKYICLKHGDVIQSPLSHLQGCGCPKCGWNSPTNEEFVKKAKEVHGDKYDYSFVEYKGCFDKIKIICPIHGEFEQSPSDHLSGCGCPKCFGKQEKYEDLINKFNTIFNYKYTYQPFEFENKLKKIKIICPIHGEFEQQINYHLRGRGCIECSRQKHKGEEKIIEWLKQNKINFEKAKKFNDLKDKGLLSYDFYIENKNLLIEYNGEQHYTPRQFGGSVLEKAKKRLKIQRHHDWQKRDYARKHNIDLLIIPYWEFKNIELILEEALK